MAPAAPRIVIAGSIRIALSDELHSPFLSPESGHTLRGSGCDATIKNLSIYIECCAMRAYPYSGGYGGGDLHSLTRFHPLSHSFVHSDLFFLGETEGSLQMKRCEFDLRQNSLLKAMFISYANEIIQTQITLSR